MKVSQNFDIREFVPKAIWDYFKEGSTKFIDKQIVDLAEFYKFFFTEYYKAQDSNVDQVIIKVNDWHLGGQFKNRGYRTPDTTVGGKYSQHKLGNAFDCEILIKYKDGRLKEADYPKIHDIICENHNEFYSHGLRCIEDHKVATGWLHSDKRWMPGITRIQVVDLKNRWSL